MLFFNIQEKYQVFIVPFLQLDWKLDLFIVELNAYLKQI